MMTGVIKTVIGFAGVVGFFLRFIGPLTIAPTITLMGISLFTEAADSAGKSLQLIRTVYVMGLKISRHFSVNQREARPKPIATCMRTFSRALSKLHVFASNSDWFFAPFALVAIGQSNYFGFCFRTLSITQNHSP